MTVDEFMNNRTKLLEEKKKLLEEGRSKLAEGKIKVEKGNFHLIVERLGLASKNEFPIIYLRYLL